MKMMTYIVNDSQYQVSYQELRLHYFSIKNYTDVEFATNLPKILHLTCMICWFKEVPMDQVIGDEGIVHQLTHLLHIPEEPLIDLKEIRKQFNEICKLD